MRTVHKKNRQPQTAEHMIIVPIKHFNTHNRAAPILDKRGRQSAVEQIIAVYDMDPHGITELGEFLLESVQHESSKVVAVEKIPVVIRAISFILFRAFGAAVGAGLTSPESEAK